MKKIIKKLLFIIFIIIALVLIAGVYKFNMTNDDLYVKLKDGTVTQIDDIPENAKLSNMINITIHKEDFEKKYLELIKQDAMLIDVRTQPEYDAGHYDGATMIDIYSQDFAKQLAMLDKNIPYFIYCRSGARSGQALKVMESLGFKEVYDLAGGFSQAQDILTIVK